MRTGNNLKKIFILISFLIKFGVTSFRFDIKWQLFIVKVIYTENLDISKLIFISDISLGVNL